MTKRKPAAHYYSFLTAAVAGLMSGQALAEDAGHVSFVYGPVTATTHDGQTRTLHRGDEISGGDRINTNAGRVQIRFTDGGFVALQPNTIFGVDQYVYANKKPEESSLFFNLVRGGMRTITGVIGHINKASYRVKTPVATIGIRGTEYLAEYDGNALNVSVGLGSVVVENDEGNITLVAGQAAYVLPNQAPQETDQTPDVGAPAPGSSNNGSDSSSSSGGTTGSNGSQDLLTSNNPGTPTAGNQQQTGGVPNGVQQPANTQAVGGPLASTSFGLPLYSLTLPVAVASSLTPAISGVGTGQTVPMPVTIDALANFDSAGDLVLAEAGGNTVFTNASTTGALQYTNVVSQDGISFGELTNGQSADGAITAASGQYIPYIVGLTGPAPAPIGSVSYTLANQGDASSPRLYSNGTTTTGTLNNFKVTIDLTNSELSLLLGLTLTSKGTNTVYSVTANNEPVAGIVQNGSFQLTGLSDVTGPACSSNCSATVSGFFAGSSGSRLGTSYDISTTTGDILGVAALTQSGGIGVSSTGSLSSSVNGSPSYTFAVPIGGSNNSSVLYGDLQATFDANGNLTKVNDSNGKLIFDNPATGTIVAPNTTATQALQYYNPVIYGDLSYGEVTDGSGTLSVGGVSSGNGTNTSNTLSVSSGLYVPYILGVTGVAPTLGIVHYSVVGNTQPREDLALTGVLNHLNVDIDLLSMELSANLQVSLGGAVYSVVANNQSVPNLQQSGTFSLSGLAATGTNCVSQSCTALINGFFAGSSSTQSQVGVAYSIDVGSLDQINGVAALGQTSAPNALVYLSNSYGSSGSQPLSADSYSDNTGLSSTGGSGSNNSLLDASSGNTAILQRNDSSGTVLATDTTGGGGDGTLEWGRWIAGTPEVNGAVTTNPLTNTDSIHYITGAPTPAVVMSALNSTQTSVNYSLEGATSPTNGSAAGTLSSGSLKVNFGPTPTMAVDLQVAIGGTVGGVVQGYSVIGSGKLSTNSPLFGFNVATTGKGSTCSATCSTAVSGFFAGAQANKVGLGYTISDSATTTTGVAAFGR